MLANLRRSAAYAVPIIALLLAGLLLFPSARADDTHITYWAAHSLSQYGEILNYNGERVEQSSSLLHVLLLALLQRLTTLDVELMGKPFSVIFGIASVVAVYKLTDESPSNGISGRNSGRLRPISSIGPLVDWSLHWLHSLA